MSTFNQRFNESSVPLLDQHFGDTVTLTRGHIASASFTAVWSDHQYTTMGEDGFDTKVLRRRFEFDRADAVVGSSTIEPRPGDQIQLTENGEAVTYEIMPASSSLPAVRVVAGGYRWSVDTKRVKVSS